MKPTLIVFGALCLCLSTDVVAGVHVVVKKDALVDLTGGAKIKILGKVKFVEDKDRKHKVAQFADMGFSISGHSISFKKDFTICLWVKSQGAGTWPMIFANKHWVGTGKGFLLGGHGTNLIANHGNGTARKDSGPTVPAFDNSWHHMAYTYSQKNGVKVYIDSNLVIELESLGDMTSADLTFFSASDLAYPTPASVDDIRIGNKVLSLKEISKINKIEPNEIPYSSLAPWPTWMFGKKRLGYTPAKLDLPLHSSWKVVEDHAPKAAWPNPAPSDFFHNRHNLQARVVYDRSFHLIAAHKNIYYGSSSDDSVTCRDARTGALVWKFFTEGPVRLAPTWHNNKLYFGSDDGFIYCVDAKTGKLVWRTQPVEANKIPGNERIISPFPIRSSILIHDKVGYFAAGLFPNQGIHYGTLNLDTGKVIGTTKLTAAAQGYLRVEGDSVFTPTGRTGGAWLDKRRRRGEITIARKPAINKEFPLSAVGNAKYVVRGAQDAVALFDRSSGKQLWSKKVQGKAYSIIIAYGSVYVSTDEGSIHCFATERSADVINQPRHEIKGTSFLSSTTLKKIIDGRQSKLGYALFVGKKNIKLALELAHYSDMKCIVLLSNPAEPAMRSSIKGLEDRLHFHAGSTKSMPYGPYLFNIVVADKSVDLSEIKRVLNPSDGHAIHDGNVIKAKALDGVGEWTHFYGDIGNTACSGDSKVASTDLGLQWFGRPGPEKMVDRHNRSVSPLYKDGTMVVSGMNWFTAVDSYNGTVLWERDIKDSMRPSAFKGAGNMTLGEKHLFLASLNNCLEIEPRSGKKVHQYEIPNSEGDWCYTANYKGLLLGSVSARGATRWEMNANSWKIGYSQNTAFICSKSLFSFDIKTKKQKSSYKPKKGVIITPTISVNNNRIIFIENVSPGILDDFSKTKGHLKLPTLLNDNAYLVALNYSDMKVLWRKPIKVGLQQALYTISSDDKTLVYGSLISGSIKYEMYCFDNRTGKKLWANIFQPREQDTSGGHGELVQHGALVGNEFFISNSSFDLNTGKRREDWNWSRGGHGCGTFSASKNLLFWRGLHPATTTTSTPKVVHINKVSRPGCWIHMIPVGGLLLIPETSSGCTCGYAIQTSMAFRPK